MIYDTYDDLCEHVRLYRRKMAKLQNARENIVAEINLFYKKNDLGTIMGFLRGLEGDSSYKAGAMEGAINPMADAKLENKMRVSPPPELTTVLPDIPQPAPLKSIKGKMKNIIARAWDLQGNMEMRDLVHP